MTRKWCSAHLIENPDKPVARSSGSQQRAPPITAKRDEVQIVSPVVPLQRIAHAFKNLTNEEKPAP